MSQAHAQALAAHEIALAAAQAEAEATAEAERERAEAEREAIRTEAKTALVLAHSAGIHRMFPGVPWEVYETRGEHYGYFGQIESGPGRGCAGLLAIIVPADRLPGVAPEGVTITLGVGREYKTGDAVLGWVSPEVSEGYKSWRGPRVTTAAEVGRQLAHRLDIGDLTPDEQQRKRWEAMGW